MSPQRSARMIPVDDLLANPNNVRDDLPDIESMARSIAANGLLSPLLVTEDRAGKWRLLAGHRRLAGARRVGMKVLPCLVSHGIEDLSDELVVMLVENVQRNSLSALERAKAYARMRDEQNQSVADIARRTGLTRTSIYTDLMLLELDEPTQERIESGELTLGTARTVVRQQRAAVRPRTAPPVGRPNVVEAEWFTSKHPLANRVFRVCNHTTRPRLPRQAAKAACGQCWEAEIRLDAQMRVVA